MNTVNWKLYRKINSVRTWSSRKVESLSEITSFLPLKFEYANYLFPVQRLLCTFYDPAEYCFRFFAEIMKGSCVFCYSSCISFNTKSHLKHSLFTNITKFRGFFVKRKRFKDHDVHIINLFRISHILKRNLTKPI